MWHFGEADTYRDESDWLATVVGRGRCGVVTRGGRVHVCALAYARGRTDI
jgi:hypothetical protein